MDRGVGCVAAAAGVSYLYELSGAAAAAASVTGGNPGVAVGGSRPPDNMGPSPGNGVGGGGCGDDMLAPPHDDMGVGSRDENYCLRWNDYEKKYAEAFRILRDNEYFTDVTLATEGHSVKAHRIILSACSNYFHAVLKSMNPWQQPVLVLQDVRADDLNSLMDFIYFGQVQMNQDSLPSFLKIAEKLKIKGLCDTLPPEHQQQHPLPPPHHVVQGSPQVVVRKEIGQSPGPSPSSGGVNNGNFENLLPRSPYNMQEVVPLPPPPPQRPPQHSSSAPPAHQSPKHRSATVRQAGEPLLYLSPKRTKYVTAAAASSLSPQSILRNQLQIVKENQAAAVAAAAAAATVAATEHVEVKSEPMTILSTSQEDVPSSGVNVNEFINQHEGDLTLPSLGQGISPQFMFSPEPDAAAAAAAGNGHQHHAGVATMVTVDENNRPIRIEGSIMATTSAAPTVVNNIHGHASQLPVSQAAALVHHHHQLQQQQQQQQQHVILTHSAPDEGGGSVTPGLDEPQDLTPAPQDNGGVESGSNSQSHHHHLASSTPTTSLGSSSSSSSPSTPINACASAASAAAAAAAAAAALANKKDRNSRKNCSYCHKDFHEMSLKRHIKDVHFRSQNTYVICPQCCKQYASQNSLYSHLNRVHGVKRELLADYDLKGGGGGGGEQVLAGMSSSPSSAITSSNGGGQHQHLVTAVRSVAPPPPLPPPLLSHVVKREVVTATAGGGGGGSMNEIHLQMAGGNNCSDRNSPSGASHHAGAHVHRRAATAENNHDGIMDLAQHSDNSN